MNLKKTKTGQIILDTESKFHIINKFLEELEIQTYEDFISETKIKKEDWKSKINFFINFRLNYKGVSWHWWLSYEFVKEYLKNWKQILCLSKTRWDRDINMFDIDDKVLAKTTYKRALKFQKKNLWFFIDENNFKLNHSIEKPFEFINPVLNRVFEKQNKCCSYCWKKLETFEAELHHKYIPQNLFKLNHLWNVEILCSEHHSMKHSKPFEIVNLLIAFVWIFKKGLKSSEFKRWKKLLNQN